MANGDSFIPKDIYLNNWKTRINEDEGIKKEFEGIVVPIDDLTNKDALEPQNEKRNRYPDLVAYDYNRVKLKEPVNGSDYINASLIRGYNNQVKYIATQAPVKDTVGEFWQMVFENNVKAMVTLTRFDESENVVKSKCFPYIKDNESAQFGSITVNCLSRTECGDWIERKLSLKSKNGEEHFVTHYHFTQWPDLGVPSDTKSIIALINKLNAIHKQDEWPFVVHCTAGIGRTGTFLTIDQSIQMAREYGHLADVKLCIAGLRRQRISLVETAPQYKFIHEALLNYDWNSN